MSDTSKQTAPPAGDGLRLGFVINLMGRGAVIISGAGVSLMLARHYGAEAFGRWSIAVASATLVGTVLDGGFHRLLMRDIGRTPEAARGILLRTVKRRFLIAAGAVPLALLIAAVTVGTLRTWLLIALLVLARLVWDVVATFSSTLLAFEKFRLPNAVEMLRRSLLLAAVVVIVVTDQPMEWAAVATLVLSIAGSSAIIRPTLRLVADKTAALPNSHWSDAAWFWLNGVLFWINAEVDQLMMGWLSSEYQVGIYAASVRLAMLCMVLPRAVNDTVVRRWFRAGHRPDQQMATTTLLLTGAGGLLGLQFVTFAREFVLLIFSSRYADSVPSFAVLGWFVFFHFARCAPSWFIATSDRVPLSTAFFASAAVANLTANIWLIPKFGALGAAYATAGCELLLLFLCYGAIGRRAPTLVAAAGLGVLPAVLALGIALMARQVLPWYVASALGVSVGGLLLLALGKRSLRQRALVP